MTVLRYQNAGIDLSQHQQQTRVTVGVNTFVRIENTV